MKKLLITLTLFISSLGLAADIPASGATCYGRFPNPVTDLCWSCMCQRNREAAEHKTDKNNP